MDITTTENNNINRILMQYFEWYLDSEIKLWRKVAENADDLKSIGITDIWLPPAYKGANGKNDVGYAVYDLYDLGEFEQKGSIETKYGTKNEYLQAIEALHQNNIRVYADIVLNHKIGADAPEIVYASEEEKQNRNVDRSKPKKIKAWTKYNFNGRKNKYSSFKWNHKHFNGTDWDESGRKNGIFRFYGKRWAKNVDKENGNYDYLMGADIDFNNPEVVEELKKWGKWYIETTNVDAFRLDAVKHIKSDFMADWIRCMREIKPLQCVGEYWSRDIQNLKNYIEKTNQTIPLFDVPLHYNLYDASCSNGNYDMSKILQNTLVEQKPELAVTFVDNHDTEPGQALCSWVQDWFKPLAYSLILLRKSGLPCVFYGDYYGIKTQNIAPKKEMLEKIMKARQNFAYGEEIDYFNDFNIIAWVRTGDEEHVDSGLVTIMSDGPGGGKQINVGLKLANTVFYDYTGNVSETVYTDHEGNGIFYCNGGSVSIWVKKKILTW
mgnify:CR=1 FL=1